MRGWRKTAYWSRAWLCLKPSVDFCRPHNHSERCNTAPPSPPGADVRARVRGSAMPLRAKPSGDGEEGIIRRDHQTKAESSRVIATQTTLFGFPVRTSHIQAKTDAIAGYYHASSSDSQNPFHGAGRVSERFAFACPAAQPRHRRNLFLPPQKATEIAVHTR